MPAQLIHSSGGRAALAASGIPENSIDANAFFIGCQGPDIFSHNRSTRPLALAYARMLHRSRYGLFCRFAAEYALARKSRLISSWLYGCITHQVFDRILHPFIVYRSYGAVIPDGSLFTISALHAFFERILDVGMVSRIGNTALVSNDISGWFSFQTTEMVELCEGIAVSLDYTYPLEADTQLRVSNAFNDAKTFYALTSPAVVSNRAVNATDTMRDLFTRIPHVVAYLHPFELPSGADWMNLGHSEWKHSVTGISSSASVEELYQHGIEKAARVIRVLSSFLAGAASGEELECETGNGSLSVTDSDGRIAPISFCNPYPLADCLVREIETRRLWLEGRRD